MIQPNPKNDSEWVSENVGCQKKPFEDLLMSVDLVIVTGGYAEWMPGNLLRNPKVGEANIADKSQDI